MIKGEIVRMRSATQIFRDDAGKFALSETYKPRGKNDFVLLCLGTVGHAEEFNADEKICETLRSFGWTVEPLNKSTR